MMYDKMNTEYYDQLTDDEKKALDEIIWSELTKNTVAKLILARANNQQPEPRKTQVRPITFLAVGEHAHNAIDGIATRGCKEYNATIIPNSNSITSFVVNGETNLILNLLVEVPEQED